MQREVPRTPNETGTIQRVRLKRQATMFKNVALFNRPSSLAQQFFRHGGLCLQKRLETMRRTVSDNEPRKTSFRKVNLERRRLTRSTDKRRGAGERHLLLARHYECSTRHCAEPLSP